MNAVTKYPAKKKRVTLYWEPVGCFASIEAPLIRRAKVPGGWLVMIMESPVVTFYPDPEHEWGEEPLD